MSKVHDHATLVKILIYCLLGVPEELLDWPRRYPRLRSQLCLLNPDLLCLQEVEALHFEENFRPDLEAMGYGSVYKQRTNEKQDGCAIFYKKEMVKTCDWVLESLH